MFILCASDAHASAWNPAQWQGELISGYVQTSADTAIDDDGQDVALSVYSKRIVQNYGNLGLTDRIALIGMFDWQDTQIIEAGLDITFSKPSSVSAGLQYQISRREGHAVAVSLSYIDGIDLPSRLLTLEGRDPSLELRVLWGESRTVSGHNVFAELQLAGRYRIGERYGGMQSQLTLGGDPSERTMVLGKIRYRSEEAGAFDQFDVAGQNRWEAELSGVYRFRKRDYLEIGYVGILDGRNTVLERGFKLGYWRKF